MAFSDWIEQTRNRVASGGAAGARESAYELWIGALRRADEYAPEGTNIYDREWDVLVVLDACRVDALRGLAPKYDYLDSPSTHRSPGSASYQWMERTFTDDYADEMARTTHITANPHSARFFDGDEFAELDEVWRDGWDESRGTVPARAVTDRAIRAGREAVDDNDRLLVHYMQPHFPSVPRPLSGGVGLDDWLDGAEHAWQKLRRGSVSEREVWRSYTANLRYVLDDVELLLGNLDAESVVITADHANAKGERGIYGHPNVPIKALREVPWFTTSAEDSGAYNPTDTAVSQPTSTSGEPSTTAGERLAALGYTEQTSD